MQQVEFHPEIKEVRAGLEVKFENPLLYVSETASYSFLLGADLHVQYEACFFPQSLGKKVGPLCFYFFLRMDNKYSLLNISSAPIFEWGGIRQ